MNDVPSSPGKRQPPPPAGQSVLRIPLAEAEDQFVARITAGRQLINDAPVLPPPRRASSPYETQPSSTEGLEEIARHVEQWRDYNRTWLDSVLGGEAAEEYKKASNHDYGYGWYDTPADNLRQLISHIETEISKLESIRGRLSIWALEPRAVTSSRTGQASADAPIFIVHGRDTSSAESVAYVVGAATGRKTVILRDEANLGQTLIEKFEKHAAEASYAIIILTPDDHGGLAGETDTRPRGRQNVIFEMGYFYGLIGRRNVSVLIRPGVEKPSDMDGIAYITFDDGRSWKTELLRELKHADIDVEL
jgi:predicted nucleotide-binding protein